MTTVCGSNLGGMSDMDGLFDFFLLSFVIALGYAVYLAWTRGFEHHE